MRVVSLGLLLVAVWSSPRICEAEPIRLHPSLSVGGALGTAKEKVTCSTLGRFECPLPRESKRSLGFQATPYFEGLLMGGRSTGFRLGAGVRYLPGFGSDTGRELLLAIVPEIVGRWSSERYVFVHFFNAVGFGFPPSAIRARQQPVLDACATLREVEGAHCSSKTSDNFLSTALEVGVLDHALSWTAVRYGIGFQGQFYHNHAFADGYSGDDPEESEDDLYVTYDTDTPRFVAFVGLEW